MTTFPTDPEHWDIAAERARLSGALAVGSTQPGCPNGDGTDIVSLSLPPYYTACPNPDLAAWLAAGPEETGTDGYTDPGPFSTDISEGKTDLIYKAHSYPTKVPYPAIMRFLLHYTRPGDVVLDGFCGTGMTGVAAQACANPPLNYRRQIEAEMGQVKWGARRAILADLSPSATFIAAGVNLPVDAQAFDQRSAEILDAFDAEWGWMYLTADERGKQRPLDYVVWSEVFTCPTCGAAVVFYDAAFDAGTGKVSDTFRCGECGKELTKHSVERRKTSRRTLAGDTTDRIELRPVAIHYRVGNAKKSKAPDEADLAVLRKIAATALPGWVPTNELPFMHMTHERAPMPAKGFTRVHHFWGDRALIALAALWKACSAEEDPLLRHALLFWVEQAIWGLSWQNRYKASDFSQVNRAQDGVYYVPSLISECHPRYNLEGSQPVRGKRRNLLRTWERSPARLGQAIMSTGSSARIDLPDESVDYVFVDPPFGSNIYYADLAYLVESWHRVWTDSSQEAIVNESRRVPRSVDEYGTLMHDCFAEFHRVLKAGRWMTVEFSNSKNEVWLTIQHALAKAGFVVADTRIIDKEQLSYRQVTAANAVKRDLIISAYKPTDELAERLAPAMGTPDTAWAFVREHLRHLPVNPEQDRSGETRAIRERLADRLYDRMGAFHLQRNMAIPVTAAEFYQGLDERFPERHSMYFLDDQLEAFERHRMTIKDLKAAQLFITDEDSAIQWIRQYLKSRRAPQPYAAIQPDFFKEVQAGLPDWEEPPDLKALLEASCVTDSEGRWYVPDPKKEADLEKLRKRQLLNEFATYATARGPLRHFSLAAIRAGFSDAWERREFASIVSVGRRLPADAFAADERLLFYIDNAEQLAG